MSYNVIDVKAEIVGSLACVNSNCGAATLLRLILTKCPPMY